MAALYMIVSWASGRIGVYNQICMAAMTVMQFTMIETRDMALEL
jgi:hypothetical protein